MHKKNILIIATLLTTTINNFCFFGGFGGNQNTENLRKVGSDLGYGLVEGVGNGIYDNSVNCGPATTRALGQVLDGINDATTTRTIYSPNIVMPHVDSTPTIAGLQGGFFNSFGYIARNALNYLYTNPAGAIFDACNMIAIPAVVIGFPKIVKALWEKVINPLPTILEKPKTKVSFKNIAGNQDELERAKSIVSSIKTCNKKNISHTNILLVGKPGTGKTLTANAIATECGLPFYKLYANNLKVYPSPVEEVCKVLKTKKSKGIINRIRGIRGSVIFIDEIDTFARQRSELSEKARDAFSQLLEGSGDVNNEFEGVLIGATNDIASLDKAVLSRFNLILYFDMPDESCRKKLFEHYEKKFLKPFDYKLNAEKMTCLLESSTNFSHRMVAQTVQSMRQKLASGLYDDSQDETKLLKAALNESIQQAKIIELSTQTL